MWPWSSEEDKRQRQNQKLLKATEKGSVTKVNALLAKGKADINARDEEYGWTPLHVAIFKRHSQLVGILLNAGANVNAPDACGLTPLHAASHHGGVDALKLLLNAGANVNAQDEYGATPLHIACRYGEGEDVRVLLNAGASTEATDANGSTPLHYASFRGHLSVNQVLLDAGANPNATDEDGDTPLGHALRYGNVDLAEALLKAGANPATVGPDRDGDTLLHNACANHQSRLAHLLLKGGADAHVQNKAGFKPLHSCIYAGDWDCSVTGAMLQTLQVLVFYGAIWDSMCEKLARSSKSYTQTPALRVCVLTWAKELAANAPFTKVPVEAIQGDAADTQAYIDALKTSKKTTYRRRLCVIGPSHWGKTSLIKSLTLDEPSLDHPDDRTIGIDIFSMNFDKDSDTYCITYWDFAGQDEYQPAHAVFFSERTVYMVCIDLHSTSLAKTQSDFRADDDVDYEDRMDEFVSRKILRWIRLVFARQPDAEFVLVGTKADMIRHRAERIAEVKEDLFARLQDHAVAYVAEVEREIEAVRKELTDKAKDVTKRDSLIGRAKDRSETKRESLVGRTEVSTSADKDGKLARLHQLKAKTANLAPQEWLVMSCKEKKWVTDAKHDLQHLLVKTKAKSFAMPDVYSNILDEILKKRNASAHQRSRQRVHKNFVAFSSLEMSLKQRIPTLPNCRAIIRTLHDLGDVLWFDNMDSDGFQNAVILDPLLLIDFIRQIYDHNYDGETMPHAVLVSRPFWVDIARDCKLLSGFKRVLRDFHLVYPSRGKIQWNSDLMVPAYWRTNVASLGRIADLPLRLHGDEVDANRHVLWEYHISSELPEAVYDHFVVVTHSTLETRIVGPCGMLYEAVGTSAFTCRALVERTGRHTVFRFEAVAGEDGGWSPFIRCIRGIEAVLRRFPGLLITRYAVNGDKKLVRLDEVLHDAQSCDLSAIKWMPPSVTWCTDLLALRLRQTHDRSSIVSRPSLSVVRYSTG